MRYDRRTDTYQVQLRREGQVIDHVEYVYVHQLGSVLNRLIDDGAWRQIRVTVLPKTQTKAKSKAKTALH